MRRFLFLLVLVGLLVAPAAALGSHGAGAGEKDFTAGGGKASVQNWGDLSFQVSAHATEESTLGGAKGRINVRGDGVALKLDVVCMTNDGDFSFIEAQDPETGLYYDVSVIDSGSSGTPDHFAISGPWGDPICGGGIAQANSFVTSGNLVVHDSDL